MKGMFYSMIKGIHHVSLKCFKSEKYNEVVKFYTEVLGLKVARVWGDGKYPDGIMFDTGNGIIELFTNQCDSPEYGIIRHFALETDDVDRCVAAVKAAGYEVFEEPRDAVIPSDPPYRIRVAFCFGPLSEQIEFFQIKNQ